jgi:hypothetical protein
MEHQEWIHRFSARLHAQWPRLPRDQRDEVAGDMLTRTPWCAMEPEAAAVIWLSQGILAGRLEAREPAAPSDAALPDRSTRA